MTSNISQDKCEAVRKWLNLFDVTSLYMNFDWKEMLRGNHINKYGENIATVILGVINEMRQLDSQMELIEIPFKKEAS